MLPLLMGKFVSVKDLAAQLGISHSTVSRALRGDARISVETRKRVENLAEALGYRPNLHANLFGQGRSGLIGVIIPDVTLHFFSVILDSIQHALIKEGFQVLLYNTRESMIDEQGAIESCMSHRADGIIAAISMETKSFAHFEKVLKYDIPLVFFDRVANFLPIPKVISNDYQSAFQATKHLIDAGRTRIAHITGTINLNNSNNRLYGYMDALREAGQPVIEELIHYYKFQTESIDDFLVGVLKKYPDLDGLFVFNDYVANYVVNALQKLNKRVPQDVAVFGFSDEPVATYMKPQLSTVENIAPRMGLLAAQKMISILKGNEPLANEKIVIEQELIIRESS